MQTIQPLGNEADILKEAQTVPAPAHSVETVSAANQPMNPPLPDTRPDAYRPLPGQQPMSSGTPIHHSSAEAIDLKPFHYALPIQNYITATLALGAASVIGVMFITTLISAMTMRSAAAKVIGADAASLLSMGAAIDWWTLLTVGVFVVLGVALLKNRKGMRLLAMGAAGVGAMYFGYHFVTFIGRGGLAMLGNPLGTVMVPVLLHYVAALGLMIYVLYHLSRARTQAAYR